MHPKLWCVFGVPPESDQCVFATEALWQFDSVLEQRTWTLMRVTAALTSALTPSRVLGPTCEPARHQLTILLSCSIHSPGLRLLAAPALLAIWMNGTTLARHIRALEDATLETLLQLCHLLLVRLVAFVRELGHQSIVGAQPI